MGLGPPSLLASVFFVVYLFDAMHSVNGTALPASQQQEFVDRHNYWRGNVNPSASMLIMRLYELFYARMRFSDF